jgi:hypothetical protein
MLPALPPPAWATGRTTLVPQPVIQAQLDAYNRHDAETFAASYAPEA